MFIQWTADATCLDAVVDRFGKIAVFLNADGLAGIIGQALFPAGILDTTCHHPETEKMLKKNLTKSFFFCIYQLSD